MQRGLWYLDTMKRTALAFCLIVLGACSRKGTVITVSGIEVHDRYWNAAARAVTTRASFDLACPAEQIELTLLEKHRQWPTQVNAAGCDRSAVYVRLMPYKTNTWVMNSDVTQ